MGNDAFRNRFRLKGRDRGLAELHGPTRLREHARAFIDRRLAPADPHPFKDGKQTPYRGHPVFVAQHATATCCRGCLQRNHGIPKGRDLDDAEREYVADVICRWIAAELAVLVRDVVNAADGWPVAEAAVWPPAVVVADE
ncbi:MAG TPA: DUF4186 domain-containing protein [Solirubrobacteraceae bacterium]